jgi:broad specificity phosphatase PhoE
VARKGAQRPSGALVDPRLARRRLCPEQRNRARRRRTRLAIDDFEATVDAFFAQPLQSVRGWEPAADAQSRIVRAVELAVSQTPDRGDIAIVGHGGTGTLLYCHLAGVAIDRRYDQPATNGGNWFTFDWASRKLLCDGWQSIGVVTAKTA